MNKSSLKTLSVILFIALVGCDPAKENIKAIQQKTNKKKVIIHEPTGLVEGVGLKLVIANCTSCHSANLVTQNRASREGWESTIRWMQATQNLWDLGENESTILDYLAKNYAPEKEGRRKPLTVVEWYDLTSDHK